MHMQVFSGGFMSLLLLVPDLGLSVSAGSDGWGRRRHPRPDGNR